jgi:hypothetical protein
LGRGLVLRFFFGHATRFKISFARWPAGRGPFRGSASRPPGPHRGCRR